MQRIYVEEPDEAARAGMLKSKLGIHSALRDSELSSFGKQSKGFSAADVDAVVVDAFARANREMFAATVFRYVNLTSASGRTVTIHPSSRS